MNAGLKRCRSFCLVVWRFNQTRTRNASR